MKVTFKNLGTIEEGSIELHPLTLLCGENNTGKTYAMYALCGLLGLRHVSGLAILKPDLEALFANGTVEIDLDVLLSGHWHSVEQKISHSAKGMLPMFFSAEPAVFDKTEIEATNEVTAALAAMKEADLEASSQASGGKTLLKIKKMKGSLILKISLTGKLPMDYVQQMVSQLIGRVIFAPWAGKVFLLPAERAGLNLFYRELNRQRSALLHHASKPQIDIGELFRDMIARYPQPIADYIDLLNDLTSLKRKKGFHHDLALEIQKEILNIKKYQIDREGNITFTPRKSEVPLNLHLGSSTVKSLFGLWFYLEHLSDEGDVLMIDEPELNLHPENQRVMACIIAKLVNRGTRVMITTHSDYFIRQINLLIMLGNAGGAGKEISAKHGFSPDSLLQNQQVGAYVFKDKGISAMEIDSSEGIIAETFDEVIRDLNRDSQEIYWEAHQTH
jgi:predicted ATPase